MKLTDQGPLTPAKIASLKPRDLRYEVKDPHAPGLQLRVTPNGVKSFRWAVHTPEGQRWITLGQWSATPEPSRLTLSQARDWLEKLKEAHRKGHLAAAEADLRSQLRPTPPAAASDGVLTVKQVADDFLKYIERQRKHPDQARRPIERDILPAIGSRALASITPQDCRRIVEDVVAGRGGDGKRTKAAPTQAGIVLGVLKQLFAFAVDRADIDTNPAERFMNPKALGVVKNISQRYLSDDEVPAFWRALDAYRGMTPTVRNGLKLLLLTGVRTGELLKATWTELDLAARTWTVPVKNQKLTREREKVARSWVVPLSPTALYLLEELSALAQGLGSQHVMASFHATNPGAPLTEKSLNHAMRRLFEGDAPLLTLPGERPTPHDLRRTVRTGLGNLGVPWHVAERCLNHSLGKIATTYDVGDYLEERRAALEKWDAHLRKLRGEL